MYNQAELINAIGEASQPTNTLNTIVIGTSFTIDQPIVLGITSLSPVEALARSSNLDLGVTSGLIIKSNSKSNILYVTSAIPYVFRLTAPFQELSGLHIKVVGDDGYVDNLIEVFSTARDSCISNCVLSNGNNLIYSSASRVRITNNVLDPNPLTPRQGIYVNFNGGGRICDNTPINFWSILFNPFPPTLGAIITWNISNNSLGSSQSIITTNVGTLATPGVRNYVHGNNGVSTVTVNAGDTASDNIN